MKYYLIKESTTELVGPFATPGTRMAHFEHEKMYRAILLDVEGDGRLYLSRHCVDGILPSTGSVAAAFVELAPDVLELFGDMGETAEESQAALERASKECKFIKEYLNHLS